MIFQQTKFNMKNPDLIYSAIYGFCFFLRCFQFAIFAVTLMQQTSPAPLQVVCCSKEPMTQPGTHKTWNEFVDRDH